MSVSSRPQVDPIAVRPPGPLRLSSSRANGWVLAALFVVPVCVYLWFAGKWSLDGDESFTLRDARQPLEAILSNSRKPLYYILAHFSLKLPLPSEFTLRLPAAVAAGFIAPTYYALLSRTMCPRTAILTSLLVASNPWLFELSQFGRHYSLMLLFSCASALSLYTWLFDRRIRWLAAYVTFGLLATLTHTTAATLFPAGAIAASLAKYVDQPRALLAFVRAHRITIGATAVGLAIVATLALSPTLRIWLSTTHGKYGSSSALQIVAAMVIGAGVQTCILAFLPLIRRPSTWRSAEVFLSLMVLLSAAPLLVLAPFGGGVSSRYLLQALPCLFVLAGVHGANIISRISGVHYELTLVGTILAFYLPYGLSTMRDGNHYDYRGAAQYVEQLNAEDPIIASSFVENYRHYATKHGDLHELGYLREMNGGRTDETSRPGRVLRRLLTVQRKTGRPLILVSNEDRVAPDHRTREWLARRFIPIARIGASRFDHRQNWLVIYRSRN